MKHCTGECLLPAKVAIVGTGLVGSTAAYTLMMDKVVSEIALVDVNKNRAEGEALDLRHGMQFTRTAKIWAGDSYELVAGAKVVVVCAGFAQKPGGEKRTELLQKNVEVFKAVIPNIVQHNKDCIILVVTNPLDALTYVALKLSKFPPCRVFGAGTVLDSARLRYLLGHHFNISPKDVTAYILGEHGDSEFVWWSGANIAGVPMLSMERCTQAIRQRMYETVKNAAYDVINKKGATYYSIALVIARIVRQILTDQSRVLSVSTLLEDFYGATNVCLSVPTVVRKNGVCEKLEISFNDEEKKMFANSAEKVAAVIEQVEKFL